MMGKKKGILERLADGPVVGDGSMVMTLERRGFAEAGIYTIESVFENPDAILQLHREYVRAGADVIQTATFSTKATELRSKDDNNSNVYTVADLNDAACKLARKAADEGDCLVCGGISPLVTFGPSEPESVLREEFAKQLALFKKHDVDLLVAEYFHLVREIEICASEIKKLNKPFALCMRLGVMGDFDGVSVEECTLRMAKTGASIIGVNCIYDPNTYLKVMKRMKDALDKEGLKPYLMCQPVGFCCPDAEDSLKGYLSLPEYPLALEPRILTRIEVHQFARAAYDLGVRYIGGCCGFEPLHIRAISQELSKERGKSPPCEGQCPMFAKGITATEDPMKKKRNNREYWYGVVPGSGRPYNPPLSKLDS